MTWIISFLEFVWVYEIYLYPLNFPLPLPPSQPTTPSIPLIFISSLFALYIILNLLIAIFSMYGFIFGLRVLDSNPARTAPVCAIAIDVALVNYFFYQLCMFREQFFPYFMVPNFLSQISVILLAIAIFSILINLQFGIEGIIKRNIINSNRMTDLIHCISIINGILGILFSFTYMNILRVNIVEFIVGTVLAIGLIVLFNFVLRKLGVNNYPIEALSRYKYGRVLTKKDKEKEKLVSSS